MEFNSKAPPIYSSLGKRFPRALEIAYVCA